MPLDSKLGPEFQPSCETPTTQSTMLILVGATYVYEGYVKEYGHRWHKLQVYEPRNILFKVCESKWHKLQVYAAKNALSKFIDLSDTNYKFMDKKIHFQSLWNYVFKICGPKWHKL